MMKFKKRRTIRAANRKFGLMKPKKMNCWRGYVPSAKSLSAPTIAWASARELSMRNVVRKFKKMVSSASITSMEKLTSQNWLLTTIFLREISTHHGPVTIALTTSLPVSYAKTKGCTMEPNTRRIRKEKRKMKMMKLLVKTQNERMKWPNVQQPIALNTSIPNVLKNTTPRNCSSILMLIHCILGVLFTTATYVASVVIPCQSSSVLDVPKHCTPDAWIKRR